MKKNNKNFECLDCIHCLTRLFTNMPDLLKWCGRKSIKSNRTWMEEVEGLGFVRLIWCEMQTAEFCSQGLSPRNANPKHTKKNKKIKHGEGITVTNQNKNKFIPNCPYCEK